MKNKLMIMSFALTLAFFTNISAQESKTANQGLSTCIPANSKIYIAEMPEDFHTFMAAAFKDVELPLFIVTDRDKADFEMKGTAAESQRNSWARVIFAGQTGSKESASVTISNVNSGIVVFSAASDRSNARRGKRSVANKMARELRDKLKEDAKKGCKL
jgi:hypothetical protein